MISTDVVTVTMIVYLFLIVSVMMTNNLMLLVLVIYIHYKNYLKNKHKAVNHGVSDWVLFSSQLGDFLVF